MGKRSARILAIAACLAVAAPVSAAETYQLRLTEGAIYASFTNVPEDEGKETLPPGDYFFADVWAAQRMAIGSEEYEDDYVCASVYRFSIDAQGEYLDTDWIGACGPADALSIDRRLRTGHVAASMTLTDCLIWDEATGECLELVELGTLVVDLDLAGVGDIRRVRGTSTSGEAGEYAYVFHGTGSTRDASPSGTFELDGISQIEGATRAEGSLFVSSLGWVEVVVGG